MPRSRHRQPFEAPATTGWQWRTFPVFFAFVCGVFLMGLSVTLGENVFGILFLVSLAGMGFGLAHILTRQIALRRAQRLGQRGAYGPAAEEPEVSAAPARRHRRRRR